MLRALHIGSGTVQHLSCTLLSGYLDHQRRDLWSKKDDQGIDRSNGVRLMLQARCVTFDTNTSMLVAALG